MRVTEGMGIEGVSSFQSGHTRHLVMQSGMRENIESECGANAGRMQGECRECESMREAFMNWKCE